MIPSLSLVPIPGLSDTMMVKLGVVLHGAPTTGRVVLFGSRAKGTHRPGSDIDLAFQETNLTDADLFAPLKDPIARVGIEIYRVP